MYLRDVLDPHLDPQGYMLKVMNFLLAWAEQEFGPDACWLNRLGGLFRRISPNRFSDVPCLRPAQNIAELFLVFDIRNYHFTTLLTAWQCFCSVNFQQVIKRR